MKKRDMERIIAAAMVLSALFLSAGCTGADMTSDLRTDASLAEDNDTAEAVMDSFDTNEDTEDKSVIKPEEPESSISEEELEKRKAEEEELFNAKRETAARSRFDEIISKPLGKSRAEIETEELSQYPELPTGCESVALTIALRSIGFDISKTEIAENYLVYGYSYVTSYLGDPFTYDGAGIFPPGLTESAENFLKAQGTEKTALNITGTELSDLYKLIENGCPVVMWSTLYLYEPEFTDDVEVYDGREYQWYTNEHCIVLYGYDTDTGTVYVSDSRAGLVSYDADYFGYIYDKTGRNSITIL